MPLGPSELILNADGGIYHLDLLPEDIADTIITVGDPDRVEQVSSYFESIELKKGKREFITHTGVRKDKRLTVISTGIGTDNIDIVLNELDALVNIDFDSSSKKNELQKLDIIRIGTSGAIQPDIEVDSLLISEFALGLDSLLNHYQSHAIRDPEFEQEFMGQVGWSSDKPRPYLVECDRSLLEKFSSNRIRLGTTITTSGFYGPQFRRLRLDLSDRNTMKEIARFEYDGRRLTNLEMETAGIYGLSKLLGHRAISLNAILANRASGTFSKNPRKTVDKLIEFALERLCD